MEAFVNKDFHLQPSESVLSGGSEQVWAGGVALEKQTQVSFWFSSPSSSGDLPGGMKHTLWAFLNVLPTTLN